LGRHGPESLSRGKKRDREGALKGVFSREKHKKEGKRKMTTLPLSKTKGEGRRVVGKIM